MSGLTTLVDRVLGNDGRHELEVHRPEPVLDEATAKAKAAAGITTVVTLLGAAGVSTTDAGLVGLVLTVLAGLVIAVAQVILTLRAAYAARARVTPVLDPRDDAGHHLAELADPAPPGDASPGG